MPQVASTVDYSSISGVGSVIPASMVAWPEAGLSAILRVTPNVVATINLLADERVIRTITLPIVSGLEANNLSAEVLVPGTYGSWSWSVTSFAGVGTVYCTATPIRLSDPRVASLFKDSSLLSTQQAAAVQALVAGGGGGGGGGAVSSVAGRTGAVVLAAADVGLGAVNNTSDAGKPVSTATASALAAKQDALVSATNIKTVNGASLLGAGDLVTPSGPSTFAALTDKTTVDLPGTNTPLTTALAAKAPSTNIAKSALSAGVQTSLGLADTSLQTAPVSSVAGKAGAVTLVPSDVGAIAATAAGAANGVAQLGADSKLLPAQVPDLAIVQFLGTVVSQAAMLALTGQRGDWCIRSDLGTVFVLNADTPATLGSWTQLSYPAAPVTSVAGRAGAVTLASTDLTDSTAAGRALLTAASAAAQLAAMGAAPASNIAKTALSGAVQTSLGLADTALQTAPVTSVAGRTGVVTLAAADVGLAAVDNTSDVNKPVSTAAATALAAKVVNLGIFATVGALPSASSNSRARAAVGAAAPYAEYLSDGTNWLAYASAAALGALVSKYVTPNGGMYLGAAAPKRLRRGNYGKKIASWGSALQNSAGTTSFVTGDLPPLPDGSTRVLRLDQNATNSFGQQNPVDGAQSYMPKGQSPGFTAGVWVKNPTTRTLNFKLTFFNIAASKSVAWNAAIEPTGSGWVFVTFSPTQQLVATWVFGTDSVNFVRVEQKDNLYEGAWAAGEYLLFGNVYIDVSARPRFLLTFDDGYASQCARTPSQSAKVSGTANVSSTAANVLTTAAAHTLTIGEPLVFTETPPTMLVTGTIYYVQTTPSSVTFTLATDYALANVAATTGFSGTAKYQYAGNQARSIQGLVESYGFRGSLFIVPLWLGTSGRYGYQAAPVVCMTSADVVSMWNDGWAVGSHSYTHPSSADNAGLRLLGPYGYFLSNTFDNLPAAYVAGFSITTVTGRRRVTSGTQASPSVFTSENAHSFIINQPIVFTDVAPTGCTLGVTYYVASGQGGSTFTLATDQGTLVALVNNTTGAWSGVSNYRHPGSSNDDSAIYADVVAGAEGIKALGISTGYKFFALPQGAWDQYVRSACIRAGIVWVRGIGTALRTINIGVPSGGGGAIPAGGWMLQQDAIQTDGAVTAAVQDGYVSDLLVQGACGCCYHHTLSPSNIAAIDRLCQTLRTKVDAGTIDVMTCDELAKELGI